MLEQQNEIELQSIPVQTLRDNYYNELSSTFSISTTSVIGKILNFFFGSKLDRGNRQIADDLAASHFRRSNTAVAANEQQTEPTTDHADR
jgi:hypothetical protein